MCIFTNGKNAYSVSAYFWLFYAKDVRFAWLHRGYAFFMRSFGYAFFIFRKRGRKNGCPFLRSPDFGLMFLLEFFIDKFGK